jgi:molecular chaperone GrpE
MKKEIDNEIKDPQKAEPGVETKNPEPASKTEPEVKTEAKQEEPKEDSKSTENKNESKQQESKEDKKKNKELDELNDKYIRLYAEYENYRKRSEKEKSESYQSGLTDTVSLFIPLLDNLDRALSFEPENEGLKILYKQITGVFTKLGIEEIETEGKSFDPQVHNAVMHEEDPEKGENLISQTFQKGYSLNGKVIRHAVVKVVN